MVPRPSGVPSRHRVFQIIGLSNPVFTFENSADNNQTHIKSVRTICMVSNPLLQNIRRLQDPMTAKCETCVIPKDFRVSANADWLRTSFQ